MDNLLKIFLFPLLWFAVAAALLFILAGAYVRTLLLAARLRGLLKISLSALLWLMFSAACVTPLFLWLLIARLYLPDSLELPPMLWPLFCFGMCFVAVYRPIKLRLPELQAAGFFRQ